MLRSVPVVFCEKLDCLLPTDGLPLVATALAHPFQGRTQAIGMILVIQPGATHQADAVLEIIQRIVRGGNRNYPVVLNGGGDTALGVCVAVGIANGSCNSFHHLLSYW